MEGKITWIFDAESTLFATEGLTELAKLFLNGYPGAVDILGKIEQVCIRGMEGKIPFNESLKERMALIQANREHVEELAELFKKSFAPSVWKNRDFFARNAERIYVVSGGFVDFLEPALLMLGILPENIFANTFRFDSVGKIIGLDEDNPLTREGGKIQVVNSLNFEEEVIIVGDGVSEARVKKAGLAQEFWVFTEVIVNKNAIELADKRVDNFGEIVLFDAMNRRNCCIEATEKAGRQGVTCTDCFHCGANLRGEGYNWEKTGQIICSATCV